ncbi:accessory factor to EIF3 [Spathaspora passalidarum NRRL Y-27907]|uniref:Clustered mitochondria protein homolog n=1 Tax=Spathaspora passalidarum (strain NRRL Y-27907 / 11-Y1) TaxID=619300 RepID=G3AFT2_SPAPN|nr:accessory factor to EIF3 [Spathaspora passalidarum NRRL Y-27907]EGW35071.1 accessory factor to EIF3 [Spathaspora passalidarum NRRL Y-27907]
MSSGEPQAEVEEQQVAVKELALKVQLPHFLTTETLTLPSAYEESLADLKQSLSIIPLSRNLTSYTIVINGVDVTAHFDDLSTFAQIIEELGLADVEELNVEIKEKAYNLAAVYDQISRFREVIGLHYIDRISHDFGVAAGVSKFNNIELDDVKPKEDKAEQKPEQEEEAANEVQLPAEELTKIAEFAETVSMKSFSGKFVDATDFDKVNDALKVPIKSLSVSQWSPVPPFQKNKGDLLYLSLQTLEHETFNITCHFSGFFVNKSSTVNFNPEIKVNEKGKFFKSFLLYDLVSSLSPSFAKTIEENEINLSSATQHPETYLLPNNSYLAYPWLVNTTTANKNFPDVSRSQLPLISNGVDGSDYVKDWNSDIQAIKELPTTSIQERILREKLIHKSIFDFNKTATETAINIIKGNLTPMNPTEEEDKHIYLKNGIFYSTGATTVDTFQATGGEEASRYIAAKDLAGVKVMNSRDVRGIYNLVTCIVDYMGKRIVCQAPVPGVLDPAPEDEEESGEKVVYGLSTDANKILEDASFTEPLKQVADVFHLKPHTVELSPEVKSKGELVVSKDSKGLKGTDGRKYVIDLYRTTPRDIEFTEQHFDPSSPQSYPHGEALVRHEAVTEWWKRKIAPLIKAAAEKAEAEGDKTEPVLPTEQVVFNPDAFSTDTESDEDRATVREISKFIKEHLVEEFLNDVSSQLVPFDGKQLTEMLHRAGISMRYLGFIAERIIAKKEEFVAKEAETIKANEEAVKAKKEEEAKKKEEEAKKAEEEAKEEAKEEKKEAEEEKEDEEEPSKATYEPIVANLNVLYTIIVREIVARSSKHILRQLTTGLPTYLVPFAVAHFHNCLLGSAITSTPSVEIDPVYRDFYPESAFEFTKLTTDAVLQLIQTEALVRFRYTLPSDWNSTIRAPQLLREIAHKFGIQWKSQQYAFTKEDFDAQAQDFKVSTIETKSKKKAKKSSPTIVEKTVARSSTFIADDIVNFVPLVKDSSSKSSLIEEIFLSARAHIAAGGKDRETGIALINELVGIQENIYGKVNAETARFYTLVAQMYQQLGYEVEAAILGRKAIVLCERTTGFDSADTITAYMNAAYYEAGNDQTLNSLKIYKHAMQTWASVYGKDHPTLINTLTNSSEAMMRIKAYPAATQFLEEALELSVAVNGNVSEITGIIYFRLANLLVSINKFKESRDLYVIAHDIFQKLLGPDDSLTKQASRYTGSVNMYIEYMNAKSQEAKKQAAAVAAATAKSASKVKVPGVSATTAASKKKAGKKHQVPQPDPEIASKSIDDILKFIEGGNQPKKGKKGSKKK